MNASILDPNGKTTLMQMGCFGIGITRLLASCIEQNHDEQGILWPSIIAPFHLIILQIDGHKSEDVILISESLYNKSLTLDIETMLDDRDRKTSPGVKFAEAELIGIPHRIVVSPRTLKDSTVEHTSRQTGEKTRVHLSEIEQFLKETVITD